jgi:hypothetical protein
MVVALWWRVKRCCGDGYGGGRWRECEKKKRGKRGGQEFQVQVEVVVEERKRERSAKKHQPLTYTRT